MPPGRKKNPHVTAAVEAVLRGDSSVPEAALQHGVSQGGIRARLKKMGEVVDHERIATGPAGPKLAIVKPGDRVVDVAAISYADSLADQVRLLDEAAREALGARSLTAYGHLAHQQRQALRALHEERLRLRSLEPEELPVVDDGELVNEIVRGFRGLPRVVMDPLMARLNEVHRKK